MPLDPHLLTLYLVAAGVLVLIPGPDSLLVLTRSLTIGRRAGWVATAGITLGNVIHAGLAAAGISALIAAAPGLFDAFRLAGTVYLVYIGARALIAAWRQWGRPVDDRSVDVPAARVLRHALLTNLLNAKVILFYLAFVPQFIAPALGHVPLQTFLLGLTLAGMGAAYLAGLAALSAGAARRVFRNPKARAMLDGVAGFLFLGFALRLFLTERKFA